MPSIKRSFFWSAIEQLGPRAVHVVIGVALARLLEPSAFGLVGMLALFLALAQVFSDLGLSASLIQRKDLTRDDETSVFALNILAGLVLAGLMCAISVPVSRFYKQPILIPLLCAHSVGTVLSSLCVVQSALMTRAMQFRNTAMIGTVSMVVAGIVGVGLAYLGFGVWSLVISTLSSSLVRTVLLWVISPWRPTGKVRFASLRSIWSFSSYLLYCNLIGITFQNLYSVIIGKVYSPASLGFYDRANTLRMVPAGMMSGIVNRVAFPLFSRCQDDKPLLLRRVREIVRSTLMVTAAALTLLLLLADPLIPLVYSEKWRPAVPLLRILCLASVLYPISALYLMSLQAQGHSNLNARLETLKFVIGIATVLLIYRYGVTALAWSVVGLTINAYFLNAWYNVKLLNYRWRMQAADIVPTILLCAASGWSAWLAGMLFPSSPFLVIAVRAAAFCLLCGLGIYLFKETWFNNIWTHLGWLFARLRGKVSPSPVVCAKP